jgi:hypothetical protein
VRFACEHTFPTISQAAYEALYFDEEFNVALGDALGLGRELVKLERTNTTVVRHLLCEPKREKGSAADQAFGSSRASFREELEYSFADHKGTWRTIPNIMKERVRNAGTLEILDDGGGARRVVRGDVSVKLFGFGGLVERLVVAEIDKSYRNAASFTEQWLARRR